MSPFLWVAEWAEWVSSLDHNDCHVPVSESSDGLALRTPSCLRSRVLVSLGSRSSSLVWMEEPGCGPGLPEPPTPHLPLLANTLMCRPLQVPPHPTLEPLLRVSRRPYPVLPRGRQCYSSGASAAGNSFTALMLAQVTKWGSGLGFIPGVVSSGDGMDGRASGRSPIPFHR